MQKVRNKSYLVKNKNKNKSFLSKDLFLYISI